MNVDTIQSLFAYNEWANARFVNAIGELTPDQFTKDLASSFPSIRDTLSHVVAVEWVWLRRWKGESPRSFPEWAVAPGREAIVARLRGIKAERAAFLHALNEPDLHLQVSYRNLKGEDWTYPLEDLLLHLVNHSTYHRGQLTTMMRQVGAAAPPTDLLVFRDEIRRRA